ncbi:MAG: universal stress protein [Capsulimonadaceae bacterium]
MIIEAHEDVVRLEGRLTKNLWPTIQAAANLLLRHHVQGIIIDASGLIECSPEGAKTFGDAMTYIERYRARIVVAAMPPEVGESVRAVPGIRSRLPIVGTVDEARASLDLAGTRRVRAQAGGRQLRDILVPLIGDEPVEAAVGLACRLGSSGGEKPTIHLVCVLEVPRGLTLSAPLPEEEAVASRVIAQAEALVRRHRFVPVRHVSRARDAGDEIALQAGKLGANIIVIAYRDTEESEENPMLRLIRSLLDHAPCEVILNKVPVSARAG